MTGQRQLFPPHDLRDRPEWLGPRRDRQFGITLIAVLVGLAVGTLVLSGALGVYVMIAKGSRDSIQSARLNQELRAALDIMQQDIRRAGFWDFADTNRDGDANGDGTFSWQDLGIDADGTGTFDADANGATDAVDLEPVSNPFQRSHGDINADLCVGTDSATGACANPVCILRNETGDCIRSRTLGSCITFSYDRDLDARIGIRACAATDKEDTCPRPAGSGRGASLAAMNGEPFAWHAWYPPAHKSKAKAIEMEMFGFRLRKGGIDMRTGRTDRNDNSFGCTSGRWEAITSSDIRILELEFALTTQIRNANPEKAGTARCDSGDPCQHIRSVDLRISGQLANDASVRQEVATTVTVRNDRYQMTP
jgi:type II secretory pathway pseudopilin PulG